MRAAGPTWSYEVKWDGYRCLALKVGDAVTLRSRNASNLTATYPAVAAALRTLKAHRALLDGEIVALDGEGHPSFQALQHRPSRTGHVLVYYAFDVLQLEDVDLTRQPLSKRREALTAVVAGSRVLLSEPLPGSPADIERELRRLDLEGAVAKRVDSKYEPGERSDAWLKVKFQLAQEFVIGGFSPDGDRVDALVVGYYDKKRLMTAGKVRAGLRPPARRALAAMLLRLKRATCPFVNLPNSKHGRWGEGITAEDMASIVWVKPSLVAQVAFTEWTDGGSLRHARFIDLRTDKRAADVVREGAKRHLRRKGAAADADAAIDVARRLDDPAVLLHCLTTRLEIDDRVDVRAEARATVQRILAGVSNGPLRRTFLESVKSGVTTL